MESVRHVDCSPASSLTDWLSPAGYLPFRVDPVETSVCVPSSSVLISNFDSCLQAVDRNSADWRVHSSGLRSPSGPRQSRNISVSVVAGGLVCWCGPSALTDRLYFENGNI